jgi:hypothetical protein
MTVATGITASGRASNIAAAIMIIFPRLVSRAPLIASPPYAYPCQIKLVFLNYEAVSKADFESETASFLF